MYNDFISYNFAACTGKILAIRHSKKFVDSVDSGQVRNFTLYQECSFR